VEAFPCGSKSTTSTRAPASARYAPRLTAVVDLPTPPFWLATAIAKRLYSPRAIRKVTRASWAARSMSTFGAGSSGDGELLSTMWMSRADPSEASGRPRKVSRETSSCESSEGSHCPESFVPGTSAAARNAA
jgi:hypothetical protein